MIFRCKKTNSVVGSGYVQDDVNGRKQGLVPCVRNHEPLKKFHFVPENSVLIANPTL